jgi:hypothetical protein
MPVEEAAQRLITALVIEFADRDDEDMIPLRRFIVDIGHACNVSEDSYDTEAIPEWTTVGDLRSRTRAALEGLAHGEWIP